MYLAGAVTGMGLSEPAVDPRPGDTTCSVWQSYGGPMPENEVRRWVRLLTTVPSYFKMIDQ